MIAMPFLLNDEGRRCTASGGKRSFHLVGIFLLATTLCSCGRRESSLDRALAHFDEGNRFMAAEDYGRAEVEFEKALSFQPDMSVAKDNLWLARER